jgi:hypothetical protein
MLMAFPVQTQAASCVIGGGKFLANGAVSAFTAEQVAYIEATSVPRLLAGGYILYDSPDIPPSSPYLWHGSYIVIIGINADGEIHGGTTRLREGWETNFACYVSTTLNKVVKRLP